MTRFFYNTPAGHLRCRWGVWLTLLALGAVTSSDGAAPAARTQVITIDYSFVVPQWDWAGDAVRVRVEGCEILRNAAQPCLPFLLARVTVPSGSRIETVNVTAGATTFMALPGPIEVGPVPVSSGTRQALAPVVGGILSQVPNLEAADPAHPGSHAQLLSVQRIRGESVALLRVFPARYHATPPRLEFASHVNIALTVAFADEARFQPAGSPPPAFDYLLVTKSSLLPAFQPLVNLKLASGLAVKTETMESILASQPGLDGPEKVRNYIRFAYSSWGVRFVLLGGDIATVPCRYAYAYMNRPEFESQIPCDLYYACLDGSWNSDGDNRWGEPTDGDDGGDVDLLGEVYVGRAPVDTPAEAATWVAKTVRYELDGNPNAGLAQFLATYLGFYAPGVHAQGGDMLDPLLPAFGQFTVNWLDDRPSTVPLWNALSALTALNLSPHVAIYNGHGDVDSLMQLGLADLDALTNRHLFLAYSVGCNAGEFDNDPFSPDCIGEQLLTRHSRGAFAAILNSRLGWFNPQDEEQFSGEFQTRFFEHLLAHGHSRLGVAHQLSKHDMIGHVESSGLMPYRWCYYEINLLGDPHVAFKPPFSGVTPQGTPHWWLASHGWTNNFEAAALSETDGDGAAAWQEFVAGTSPVNPLSVLKAACLNENQRCVLQWPSAVGRVYSIHGSSQLDATTFVELTNHIVATPPLNRFDAPGGGASRAFYRIQARREP